MKKHQNLLTYFLNPNCYNFCIFYIETHLNQKRRSICKISSNFMPQKFLVTFHSFFFLEKVIFKKKQHACGYKSLNQIRVLKHPTKCLSKKNSCMNLNTEKETDHPNSNINIIVFFFHLVVIVFPKTNQHLIFDSRANLKIFSDVSNKNVETIISSFWRNFGLDSFLFFLVVCFCYKAGAFFKWAF